MTPPAEAIVARMVANDAVMPSQWMHGARPFNWQQRLMVAALDDAFRRLRSDTPAGREALAWFHNPDRYSPYAYLVICETFDLPAERGRRRADEVWGTRLRSATGEQPLGPRVMRRVAHSRSMKIG